MNFINTNQLQPLHDLLYTAQRTSGQGQAKAIGDARALLSRLMAAAPQAMSPEPAAIVVPTSPFRRDSDSILPPLPVGTKLYTLPIQHGLNAETVIDAERWKALIKTVRGERDVNRQPVFAIGVEPLKDAEVMKGSIAEHFTNAVDALRGQTKEGVAA